MSDNHQSAGVGSSLDDFLHEQGLYDGVEQEAIKRVLSFQIENAERAESDKKCAGQPDGNQPLRA